MIRLGILGSTRGTNMTAVIEAIRSKKLIAEIAVVLSNKQDALILEKGMMARAPSFFVDSSGLSRDEYDKKISQLLSKYAVDYVVLIGYMRILSASFVSAWRNRIINIHPSLLPKHAGKMDLTVHQSVLEAGDTETGCTVHYVVEEVDAGPVLLQKKCSVMQDDTAEMLKERVQALEGDALVEALIML